MKAQIKISPAAAGPSARRSPNGARPMMYFPALNSVAGIAAATAAAERDEHGDYVAVAAAAAVVAQTAAAHEQENEPQAVAAAEIEIIHVSPPYF